MIKKGYVVNIYLILFMLVLLLFSKSEALTNYGVVIPFIQFNPVLLLLIIILIGFFSIFLRFRNVLHADLLSIMLLLRVIVSIFPLIHIDKIPSSYIGNFCVLCFPFLMYLFFLNSEIDIERVSSLFIGFGLIIAVQCIFAYFTIVGKGLANYSDPFYKGYFVIPIGATNEISAFILPLLIFGDLVLEKKWLKISYVSILSIAIFLCKSRTGILFVLLYFGIKFLKKRRGHTKRIKWLIIFLAPIGLVGLLLFAPQTDLWIIKVQDFFMGFASSANNLDSLLSGRFTVFKNVLLEVMQHPIIGNGVSYEILNNMRAHNVVLCILYENGIIGLFIFAFFLVLAGRRIWSNRYKKKEFYAFSVAVIFIIANSMIEEIFFSFPIELFGLSFVAAMREQKMIGGNKNV